MSIPCSIDHHKADESAQIKLNLQCKTSLYLASYKNHCLHHHWLEQRLKFMHRNSLLPIRNLLIAFLIRLSPSFHILRNPVVTGSKSGACTIEVEVQWKSAIEMKCPEVEVVDLVSFHTLDYFLNLDLLSCIMNMHASPIGYS